MSDTPRTAKFSQGFSALFAGWKLLAAERKLLKYAIIPGIINAAVFLGFVYAVYSLGAAGFSAVLEALGISTAADAGWLLRAAAWLATVVLAIAFVVAGYQILMVVYSIVSGIVCGPFNALLARKTYLLLRGLDIPASTRGEMAQLFLDIGYELRLLYYQLSMQLFMLLFNLIPVVGTVLYTLRSHYFTWTLLGWDHLTRPLGRMGMGFKDCKTFIKAHGSSSAGFGAAVFFCLLVPGLNIVVMPAAVSGGIILYIKLEAQSPPELGRYFPNRKV